MAEPTYIPALSYSFLTRWYDGVVRWTTREAAFRKALLAQVAPKVGHRILDVGCGTGSFAVQLKLAAPGAEVTGLDGDANVLAIARNKAQRAGLDLVWVQSSALLLPLPEARFHAVVSSLFFHHLDLESKRRALAEIGRVLEPGGELHIADWGRPGDPLMRAAFLSVQFLDGFKTTRDSVAGRLPELIAQAGFVGVEETKRMATPCGSLSLYRADKPLRGCLSLRPATKSLV
ncbi:MAG: class I SAM-dependent methyltransferase [Opitutaceae bacterium]|jgi:ubiquinone/menaquinone biosynthesis C-methylase UbiE|nr:class I SAM-dependent methyltransferase [Opitutaceae bacterium]